MYCPICKINRIGPNTTPYGGFFCTNEHMQCHECNAKALNKCVLCLTNTYFVKMVFVENALKTPSAPPLELILPLGIQPEEKQTNEEKMIHAKQAPLETTLNNQLKHTSIAVSTESEPNLFAVSAEEKTAGEKNTGINNFLVMQSVGVAKPADEAPKMLMSTIDMRMTQVMETIMEDLPQKPFYRKPRLTSVKSASALESPEFDRSGLGTTAAAEEVTDMKERKCRCKLDVGAEIKKSATVSVEETTPENMLSLVSNSYRAYYEPSATQNKNMPQMPKFEKITSPILLSDEDVMERICRLDMRPVPTRELLLSHAPICCPDTMCSRNLFLSDFSKHLIDEHHLPNERMSRLECKSFFLDPSTSRKGILRCHKVYLVQDMITDLGSSKYKDFLPLVVMSTKVRVTDFCDLPDEGTADDNMDILMIWVTGINSEVLLVPICISAFASAGNTPTTHLVKSGHPCCIRNSNTYKEIFESGDCLILPTSKIDAHTKDGHGLIEVQLMVQ